MNPQETAAYDLIKQQCKDGDYSGLKTPPGSLVNLDIAVLLSIVERQDAQIHELKEDQRLARQVREYVQDYIAKSNALRGEVPGKSWYRFMVWRWFNDGAVPVLVHGTGDYNEAQRVLLKSSMNDKSYYVIFDVEQQRDVFTTKAAPNVDTRPTNLTIGVDPASPGGDQSVVVVAHTDNGTLIIDEATAFTGDELSQMLRRNGPAFYEKMQSLDEMHCMFGSKPPTRHDLLAGDL